MTSTIARMASALCLAATTALGVAHAGPVADRVQSNGVVRVCIWPAYYGITWRSPRTGELSGIDIELAAEFARSVNAKLEWVETSFARFIDDLSQDRCDVAMFGIGITAQRQQLVRFSQPYLRSGIYGVATRASRVVRQWDDIDRPGVRVAVQAGTFMEPVMAAALKRAEMVVIKPPATREQELEAGRVDVFMTDYPYSRRLLDNADWARLVSPAEPFNPVPYAYAVKPGDNEWLTQVDRFVEAVKRDGRLEAAARRFGLTEIVVRQ